MNNNTQESKIQLEYIEKPKALSFAVYEGKLVSCIPPVQREPLSLTGQGILRHLKTTPVNFLF